MPPSMVSIVKSRVLLWAGYVARMGKTRNGYEILVGKTSSKVATSEAKMGGTDKFRIALREIHCEGMKLAQYHVNGGHSHLRCCTIRFYYQRVS